jgi:outer membrane receptor protein involved in Fe transport
MRRPRPTPRALGALLLTLLAVPARADNTADEADLRFRRGVGAYRARRFDDALAEFFQSNRLVKNRNVLLNIARCYEQLKRYDEAYRYYAEVLGESPSPEDLRLVEESQARLAPRVALLQIATEPPGADVFVERKDLGSRGLTPKALALPEGRLTLLLSLAGHRDARREVALATGRSTRVVVPLEFIWGKARLEGEPAGAQVRVDRADAAPEATLPGSVRLRPGRHILHVSAPGHIAAQIPVEAQADREEALSVKLQPLLAPTGTLVVTANHEGALVQVDGKEAGFTPAVLSLPVGEHQVAVIMSEMRPHRARVEIEEGGKAWLKAELRYGGARTTAASKTETSVEESPASITVITRDEIRAFGYTSLPEALRAVRGIFVTDDRAYQYLGVRGFSPPGDLNNRILILYDGHTMNDIYAGQAYVGRENNIDLEQVERIEVVRGPVSSLFGSAAFFGVINIVPRHDLGERNAELSGAAGSLGLARARAAASARFPSGEVLVTAGVLKAANESLYLVPAADGASEILAKDRDGESAVNASARVRWGELTLFGSFNSRGKQVPTGAFDTVVGADGTSLLDQRGFVEGRYEKADPEAGSSFAARLYYDATRYRGSFQYADYRIVEHGEADWAGLELRTRSPELFSQHLTAGVELQSQFRVVQRVDVPNGLDDRRSFWLASIWAADELRLSRALIINASVRADDYLDSFGLTVNPRLAVIGRLLAGGTTKLMGGRSFRAPTVYERFYFDGSVDPLTRTAVYRTSKPNPGLRPESALTAEFEHAQEIGDDLKVTGAIFVNQLRDLIYARLDVDGLSITDNSPGLLRTEGAELEVRWQPSRLAVITAAYWYQHMVMTGIRADQASRLSSNAPAHAFSVRGMFPISAPLLVGAAEAIYNGPRFTLDGSRQTGEMLLLSLGLSGELAGGAFRYNAGVQNLLDERPRLPADLSSQSTIPLYGRTFLLQLAAGY